MVPGNHRSLVDLFGENFSEELHGRLKENSFFKVSP
jgi:hypothetical protein